MKLFRERRSYAHERPRQHHVATDALEHPGILLALLVTALLLPLLLVGRMSTATAMPRTVQVSAVDGPVTTSAARTAPKVVTPVEVTTTTTPTTAAPVTTATTAAPPTTEPAPTTTVARTTPSTAPRPVAPPPTAAPVAAPTNSESGGGTWYSFRPGTCAHKTLPMGTVVHITDTANGATATCVVADRGPFGAGRILDMDPSVFQQLAPLSAGVIPIIITW